MAVSLQKGGKVSLSKQATSNGNAAGLTAITIGVGWDIRATDGDDFDLDGSAFELTDTGKVKDENGFVFYGNKASADGAIQHTGDNRTGAGDGDDEQIKINLAALPADIQKVAITVTIDKAAQRNQNFGMVSNAFIRVVDDATGTELARFDLSEDYSTETAIIFGAVYRHNGEWKFEANGQGFAGGLAALAGNYGIDVA